MALDDGVTESQTDPGSGAFFATVEPLKYLEETLPTVRIDADAFVANRDQPLPAASFGFDGDPRRFVSRVFDRLAHEVLKVLVELTVVAAHARKRYPPRSRRHVLRFLPVNCRAHSRTRGSDRSDFDEQFSVIGTQHEEK